MRQFFPGATPSKDEYAFDFLGADARERDVERGALDHIQRFLLELGSGFAFVGRQHHLEVGGEDFYLDLLFYQMNFHLSAADDLLARREPCRRV